MKTAIGKFLKKFGISQKSTEAEPSFKGEEKMEKKDGIAFRKLAQKYGIATATILAGDRLLDGKEELSHDEWWDVYLASPCRTDLHTLAEAKMLETATTADQLARRIGAYSKEEHLRYLVKASGMASTMQTSRSIRLTASSGWPAFSGASSRTVAPLAAAIRPGKALCSGDCSR